MQPLINSMRAHAVQALDGKVATRLGVVESYDPNTYSVKVTLQPDGTGTGWIPVGSPWVGNGWGLFSPPSPGDQVEIGYQEDDRGAPIARLRLFDVTNMPLPCPSGEFWLVHKTGAFFKLTNDGKALINGQVEIDATAPTINITATSNVSVTAGGNATVQASGTATVQAASIILKNAGTALKKLLNSAFAIWAANHVHSNGNGGANTGTPTTTPDTSTQTSIVQAE